MAKAKGRAKRSTDSPPAEVTVPPKLAAILDLLAALPSEGDRDDDLDRAQSKAFDAMEAPDPVRRIALAKEALAISPLCADGYYVLAGEAATPAEAAPLYRRAMDAAASVLGAAAFEEDVGLFWGLIETRPYMRARHGLALALWELGERDAAIAHYQDMLRLNPNDNQGIRYLLLGALIELGRNGEAGELIKRYRNDWSAAWAWSRALLSFRQKGDVAASRKALARAVEANPHVTAYLLGRKRLPRTLPPFIGIGDETEAADYVDLAKSAWKATAGALIWVATSLEGGAPPAVQQRSDDVKNAVTDRIDDAVLALLLLGLHDGDRTWKSFDWAVMERLHHKGLISNPVGKAKSIAFTEEGLKAARRLHEELFVKGPVSRS